MVSTINLQPYTAATFFDSKDETTIVAEGAGTSSERAVPIWAIYALGVVTALVPSLMR